MEPTATAVEAAAATLSRRPWAACASLDVDAERYVRKISLAPKCLFIVITIDDLDSLCVLRDRKASGLFVIGVNGSIGSYLREVEGAISCGGDGARRAQAGPSKHLACKLLLSFRWMSRGSV